MVRDSRQSILKAYKKIQAATEGNFPKKAGEIFEVNNCMA